MGRTLAIDPGERRLGLALSDPTRTIAQPYAVRERRGWKADLAYLRGVIVEQDVDEIVVGRPLTMRGEAGPAARAAARFAARLRAAVAVPVHEVDERLSTAAARRSMRDAGQDERAQRGTRDAVAAAVILQTYLHRREPGPLRGSGEGVMLAP